MVVNQWSCAQHHTHIEGRLVALRAVLVEVHLVSLTAQSAQRQVPHHHDSPCGFVLLLYGFVYHSLPVVLVNAVLHRQLVVEVLVLEPVGSHAPHRCPYHQHLCGQRHLPRAFHAAEQRHQHKKECQSVVG